MQSYRIKFAALLILVIGVSCAMESSEWDVDTLILDPVTVLEKCNAVREQYGQKVDKHKRKVSLTNLPQTIAQEREAAEKKCPIFSLQECSKGFCYLTRSKNPRYRATYEDRVVSALCTLAATKSTINYVSFGSSQLFQDAVILAKFLKNNPTASMNIQLIDVYYTPFCFALGLLNGDSSGLLDIDNSPNFLEVIDKVREKGKKEWYLGSVSKLDDVKLNKALLTRCENIFNPFVQLHRFLMSAFPESCLKWNAHSRFSSYFEAVENEQITCADILTAADITDFGSKSQDAPLHHAELCNRIMQKKELVNLLLLYHPVGILSLANAPREGYTSVDVCKSGSEEEYEMFEKVEPIE